MTKKKNKQLFTILALCMILAVLGICYYFAERYAKNKEEAETEDEIELYSMKEDEVYKIHYVNQMADVTLVKEDDIWKLEEDKEFPVAQSIVETMVEDTASVAAKSLVTKNCEDLEQYQLEEPLLTITLEDKKGNEQKIAYGLETAAAGGCYAYTEDSRVIYVVPSNVTSDFEFTKNQLMEIPDIPEIDEENLISYSVKNAAGKSYQAAKDDLEDIAYSLSDLSIAEGILYKASAKEQRQYGLAEPTYVITVKYETTTEEESLDNSATESTASEDNEEKEEKEKHTFRLSVGEIDDTEENYYVSIQGEEGIYLMPADVVDAIISELK